MTPAAGGAPTGTTLRPTPTLGLLYMDKIAAVEAWKGVPKYRLRN